ncbi:helix-turn-helix domain-containing protein [Clostridioides sp. ZZV14-6048]|uniref:helix-turn-helix domain-containing protein n=1 Tax=Clostridioides sp. ZZV14-6048 TaxID=2811490 RepID=UPI001D1155A9|nr:helix-turn-helix transcriptional regulator [Clostridioides sp. ZZV14-6048]
MNIGDRLKETRKSKGISQESLAEQLKCSRGVITNIEYGKTEPTQLVLDALCNILNVNKEWLLLGAGEQFKKNNVSQSEKVLSEIYSLSKELTEEEQLYILDLINTFKKHKNNFNITRE